MGGANAPGGGGLIDGPQLEKLLLSYFCIEFEESVEIVSSHCSFELNVFPYIHLSFLPICIHNPCFLSFPMGHHCNSELFVGIVFNDF